MIPGIVKGVFPYKFKRKVKEHLGVPSLHWSLENLKRKGFNPAVTIDIGAYEGFWTLDVLEVFPSTKILMVDAQKSKEPFLKAISEKYGNVDYAISLLSSGNSTTKYFAEKETASHVVTKINPAEQYLSLETRTLDALLEPKGFPLPDLLKLDVQGHEMEVLKGAERSLSNAGVCLLEISLLDLGEDVPLLAEMVSFMDTKGFQAYDISNFIRRPLDKALYQVDMFFVKKDSMLIADKRW